jgi:HEAT repeat protein
VQKLSQQTILEHAQSAAKAGHWSMLTQCLQDLFANETSQDASKSLFSDSNTATVLLELALQVLEFGSFHDRWEVSKLIPNFGIDAIAPLIDLLTDEDADPESQWFAVRMLGDFNHPRVVTALIDVLKASEDEELNAIAISALANLGKPVIPVLEEILHDRATTLLAVQTLGQIRHSEIVPLLLQVVKHDDPHVRAIAIEALSSFHSPEITTVLIEALKDLSVPVRRAATTGLGFCHADDAQGIDLVAQLRPLLFDLNIDVCRQSVISLGRLGTPDAISALLNILHSPNTPEPLAIEIIRALGWSNTAEGLNALQFALKELSLTEAARLELLTALGRVELPELRTHASEILMAVLQSGSPESESAKQAIALSLGQLGNVTAIEPLIHLLSDPDVGVRLHVISALKTLDSELAHQQLETLSHSKHKDPELEKGIAIALQEWHL